MRNRLLPNFFALILFCLFAFTGHAQVSAPTASSILSPSLDQLRQSLTGLRLDKWKAPGPVREDANSNIASITHDLDGTLPSLLQAADAAPGVVSKNLPVFRNIDALYDVLLRVVETADLAAPDNEAETLNKALGSLENARRSFGDAIESAAATQEQQMDVMRNQIRAQAAAAAPSAATTVVNDSVRPAAKTTSTAAHKKKAAPAKPVPTPPPSQ